VKVLAAGKVASNLKDYKNYSTANILIDPTEE
jgi:hypothetical protein